MSCEHALNLDQWKTFSENYKPMKVWLWLVYKFTKNCQIYRLFSEFIQTKKRYPTHLEKIRILTRKLLVISSGNFSWYLISVTAPLRFLCALKFSLKKDLVFLGNFVISWDMEVSLLMFYVHVLPDKTYLYVRINADLDPNN